MANETQMFDKDGVISAMDSIGSHFSDIASNYTTASTEMTTALSSPDGAMWGEAADKLLSAWDANSPILDEFMKTFENWSALISATVNKFGNLETETALVDDDNIDNIAAVIGQYKSSWLKTDAAKKAYIGGSYTKTDEDGTVYTINKSLETGLTKTYTDANGSTITELYSLSGAYIGKKVVSKSGGTSYYNKENEKSDKDYTYESAEVKKAKKELAASAKTIAQEKVKIQKAKEEAKKKLSDVVAQATEKYSDEVKKAVESKVTENLFMTVTKENVNGNTVYISHLVMKDPSQLEKLVANGRYNNGRETISSMASKAGVVWAVNGSHYDVNNLSTQDYRNNNITIVNGKVVHNGGRSVGQEICYTKDGKWFTAPKGASAQDLLNMGVVETYSSLQMPILENGKVVTPSNSAESAEMNKSYNRTVIGQTPSGEVYVFTGYSTTRQAAEYLRKKGCTWAKSMDMGGSVTLYANGKVINKPTDGSERPVIDGIGVSV